MAIDFHASLIFWSAKNRWWSLNYFSNIVLYMLHCFDFLLSLKLPFFGTLQLHCNRIDVKTVFTFFTMPLASASHCFFFNSTLWLSRMLSICVPLGVLYSPRISLLPPNRYLISLIIIIRNTFQFQLYRNLIPLLNCGGGAPFFLSSVEFLPPGNERIVLAARHKRLR